MIKRWLSKYFATVFVLATLMGVFHQHSNLQVHEDCQICVVASSIADGDTPEESLYLKPIEKTSLVVQSHKIQFFSYKTSASLHARAPPKHS